MPYRKVTLRRMSPVTRKYARLLGDLESVLRRGKNLVEEIQRLELDTKLWQMLGKEGLSSKKKGDDKVDN